MGQSQPGFRLERDTEMVKPNCFFLDWRWGSFPGIMDLRSSTHDTCVVDDYFMTCVLPRTIYILEIYRFLCILILQIDKVET